MFTAKLTTDILNTDRILTVYYNGYPIGQCDPFVNGIPLQLNDRQAKLRAAVRMLTKAFMQRKGIKEARVKFL